MMHHGGTLAVLHPLKSEADIFLDSTNTGSYSSLVTHGGHYSGQLFSKHFLLYAWDLML